MKQIVERAGLSVDSMFLDDMEDKLIWVPDILGIFSTTSAYD